MNAKKDWGPVILALMAGEANQYGVYCGSQSAIAATLKTSKRSVNQAVRSLEIEGKITRVSDACYKVLVEVVPRGTSWTEESPETRASVESEVVPRGTSCGPEVVPSGTSCRDNEEKQRIKEELDKYLIANGIKGERREEEAKPVGELFVGGPHRDSPLPQTPSPVLDIYNIYNTGGERGVGREGGKHKFSELCPPSVSQSTWDEYMLARDDHPKAKQTNRAINALVNKLNRFEIQGQDPETMVRRSIEGGADGRCWITVYPARRRESLVAGRSLPNLPYPLRDALNTASRGIPLSPQQEQVMVRAQAEINFKPRPGETWKSVAARMLEALDEKQGSLL